MLPIIVSNPEPAIKLTKEQAIAAGIDINADEQRGVMKSVGPWNLPVSYTALCMSGKLGVPEGAFTERFIEKTIHGMRTMRNIRQGGYEIEGWVSIGGKKYSCFSSSQLFEVDGRLLNVAVIHARIK